MCPLFTQVISKSLENLAMFMWIKGWETSTRMIRGKTLSRNLSASIDGITKTCCDTLMLKHLPAHHHKRAELIWPFQGPGTWPPHLSTLTSFVIWCPPPALVTLVFLLPLCELYSFP